jgi:hypothetical protein
MRQLTDSGQATSMLPGLEIGPTWYDGRWWYVPVEAPDDADYQPADQEKSESFDRLKRRADAIEQVQAELDGRQ